jgi:hypothetical protein
MCALITLAFIALFGVGIFVPVRSSSVPPANANAPTVIVITPTIARTPTAFVPTATPTVAPRTATPTLIAPTATPTFAEPTAVAGPSTLDLLLANTPNLLSCEPIPDAVSRALVDNTHSDFLTTDRGWTYTPGADTLKTTGIWIQGKTGSVAYLELLHYDCGIPPNAVDEYFNATNFPTFFAGYDYYELIIECARGDQRHFIFETAYQGTSYEARYWVEPLAPTRLALFSLFTPLSQGPDMRRLARQMYPDLPDCQNAGAG